MPILGDYCVFAQGEKNYSGKISLGKREIIGIVNEANFSVSGRSTIFDEHVEL